MNNENLNRFLEVQQNHYRQALREIENGQKESHWMWFIFPQLKGLGRSETAKFYGLDGANEAVKYLSHPILRNRLIEISEALLAIKNRSANQIFGSPDDMKLRSCMTLFSNLSETGNVFDKVLDKYFDGRKDELTIQLMLQP